MDISTSLTPEGRIAFEAIPRACIENFADSLVSWKIFEYGTGGPTRFAATPRNSSLGGYISESHERNLALVIALVKHSNPASFMIDVEARLCTGASGEDAFDTKKSHEILSHSTVPYQIEHSNEYAFDPSRCGRFSDSKHPPCWFDLGGEEIMKNPYETEMGLFAPGVLPEAACDHSRPSSGWTASDRMEWQVRAREQIARGNAWHADDICPDYRLLCGTGSADPPNLPHKLAPCGPPTQGRWIQLPRYACRASDPTCAGQRNLLLGRLPHPSDQSMQWINVHETSELCKASTLAEAARIAESWGGEHTNRPCSGQNVWVADEQIPPLTNPGGRLPIPEANSTPVTRPYSDWVLIKDHLGIFEFAPRYQSNRTPEADDIFITPMSERYKFADGIKPFRAQLKDDPPPIRDTSSAASSRWAPQAAAVAAAVVLARCRTGF